MRAPVRILTAGVAAALMALALLGSGGSQAATPHGLTVPAQVSASNWTTMPNPTAANATNTDAAVSCVTSAFCMAVGNGGHRTPERRHRRRGVERLRLVVAADALGAERDHPIPQRRLVRDHQLLCRRRTADIAGTNAPLIEQWNGAAWSVVQAAAGSTASSLLSVSCTSTTFCMATGPNGNDPSVDAVERLDLDAHHAQSSQRLQFHPRGRRLLYDSLVLHGRGMGVWRALPMRMPNIGTDPRGRGRTPAQHSADELLPLLRVVCRHELLHRRRAPRAGANLVETWNGGSAWTNADGPDTGGRRFAQCDQLLQRDVVHRGGQGRARVHQHPGADLGRPDLDAKSPRHQAPPATAGS